MFDDVYENKILYHGMLHHNMDMLMLKEQSMMLIISIHLFIYFFDKNNLINKTIKKKR
jgi:hypothetical protein